MVNKLIILFLTGAGSLILIGFGLWFIVRSVKYFVDALLSVWICVRPPSPAPLQGIACEASIIQYVVVITPILLLAWLLTDFIVYEEPAEGISNDR